MTTVRPLYLASGNASVSALYHPAAEGSERATAVAVCAPWGWDEIASYRTRRRWAERLAEAGHPTLRFDLPGGGDSTALPTDPGIVKAWLGAIADAAAWLRQESHAPAIALLGLGLGGLLGMEAVAGGGAAVEELILWGAPRSGRLFARETRAFSAMQDWNDDGATEELAGPGSVEAGGFVLSGETKAELTELKPAASADSTLRRALLLDRDGVAIDREVVEGLEAAGVEVTLAAGPGWGLMVSHPERSKLSAEAAAEVERWLDAGSGAHGERNGSTAGTGAPESGAQLSLRFEEATVKETPLRFEFDLDLPHAYGVLAEPAEGKVEDCCAVFLNAGAIRHVGPNRIWVEAARRAASRGVPSLRADLEAIGEADGDEDRLRQVGEFFVDEYVEQVGAILDELERRGVAKNFILIGLCAGAFWSFRSALEDPRIRSVLLLNSGALVWHPDMVTDRAIRDLSRLRQLDWWRRLITGGHTLDGVRTSVNFVYRKLRQLARRVIHPLRAPREGAAAIETDLGCLRGRDTRLTLAFSAGETLLTELGEQGILENLHRWPNTRLVELPGDDHTLRPLPAQAAANELIDREICQLREQVRRTAAQSSSSIA